MNEGDEGEKPTMKCNPKEEAVVEDDEGEK